MEKGKELYQKIEASAIDTLIKTNLANLTVLKKQPLPQYEVTIKTGISIGDELVTGAILSGIIGGKVSFSTSISFSNVEQINDFEIKLNEQLKTKPQDRNLIQDIQIWCQDRIRDIQNVPKFFQRPPQLILADLNKGFIQLQQGLQKLIQQPNQVLTEGIDNMRKAFDQFINQLKINLMKPDEAVKKLAEFVEDGFQRGLAQAEKMRPKLTKYQFSYGGSFYFGLDVPLKFENIGAEIKFVGTIENEVIVTLGK